MVKTVYITGAEGFLGRHAALLLKRQGWRVIGLGHPSLPSGLAQRWGIADSLNGAIEPNLLQTALDRHGPPVLLIHAAGTSMVGRAAANPYDEFLRTSGATQSVVEFMRRRASQARLIYVSSAAVYGSEWDAPIPVSAAVRPISEYGLHKHICEQLVLGAGTMYGFDVGIVRFFSLYGPGLTKQLLWDVARRLETGENLLQLGGTGNETRDFLYIEDAARLLSALAGATAMPRIINGASGRATRIADVVRLFVEAGGRKARFEFSGAVRSGDPRHLVADVSCVETLGFRPRISLESGLAAYAGWARLELASGDGEGGMTWR